MGREDLARESDLVLQPGGGYSCGIRSLCGGQDTMKIQLVNSRAEIASLDSDERVVHLTFPISTVDLLSLMKRCPRLEAIQAPPSLFRNMFKSSRRLLDVRRVKFFEGTIQGYRTGTDDHYTIDDDLILLRMKELRAEGLDSEEILAKVAEEAEVSPGLVEYILGR